MKPMYTDTRPTPYDVQQANLGRRFTAQKTFSSVDGKTLYFLFENPIDSGVEVELQLRKLKPEQEGVISLQILWDYDVSNASPVLMPVWNQNNKFRVSKPGKAVVSVLSELTASPDNGEWPIGAAAYVPTDEGIERESDFVATVAGQGQSSSAGDISPDLGVRIYAPGTGFLTKLVMPNSGRLIWGYDWFEEPIG